MEKTSSQSQSKELSLAELKAREIAEEYVKIQENTQFLIYLQRFNKRKRKVLLKLDSMPINLESLYGLMVQISYLLYTCNVSNVNVYISQEVYCLNYARKEFGNYHEGFCEYVTQKEFLNMGQAQQNYVSKKFKFYEHRRSDSSFGEFVFYHINRVQKMVRPLLDKIKSAFAKNYNRQYDNLEVVKQYLQPMLKKITVPRIIMLCLEETQIYRQNSTLLKIMNNSIFTAIRITGRSRQIIQQLYNKEKMILDNAEENQLGEKTKNNETIIEECMKYLIRNNVLCSQQSLNSNQKGEKHSKPYALGEVEVTTTNEQRKYFCKIHVIERLFRNFNKSSVDRVVQQANNNYYLGDGKIDQNKLGIINLSQINLNSVSKNDFVIEYLSSKSIISIKYFTNIELNIENTDLMMYQCNNISYSWSSVSMELVERPSSKNQKRKERCLVIKTLCHINQRQPFFFNILLSMDLVMLCGRLIDSELKKQIVKAEDYYKIHQANAKIDHMINIFIKKIQSFYKIGDEK